MLLCTGVLNHLYWLVYTYKIYANKVQNNEWTNKISLRILHPNTVFGAQPDLIITLEANRHAC